MNHKELALFSLGAKAFKALEAEIIAAHTAKLLAGVEIPEPVDTKPELRHIPNVGTWYEDIQLYTKEQLQQYAAAAAAQARMVALDEAKEAIVTLYEEYEPPYLVDICKAIDRLNGGE